MRTVQLAEADFVDGRELPPLKAILRRVWFNLLRLGCNDNTSSISFDLVDGEQGLVVVTGEKEFCTVTPPEELLPTFLIAGRELLLGGTCREILWRIVVRTCFEIA